MAELDQRYLSVNPVARLALGLVACAAMWVAASFAVAVWLTSWSIGFDSGNPEAGDTIGVVALGVAAVLFVGGGPVAFVLSRRRWTLLLPVIGLAVWAVGIGVAAIT